MDLLSEVDSFSLLHEPNYKMLMEKTKKKNIEHSGVRKTVTIC